jgi:hypothetical protein
MVLKWTVFFLKKVLIWTQLAVRDSELGAMLPVIMDFFSWISCELVFFS